MARKLTVYTGKGVGVFDLSARPDMYTEPQAATIVLHDQDEHERVFTESEVRAMLDEIHGLARAYWDNAGHGALDMLSASEVAGIAERGGILLDPA